MKAIDPSEILIGKTRAAVNEETTRANPWLRLAARFLDYGLFFFLLLALRPLVHRYLTGNTLIPFEYALWIPIEALLLHLLGSTPGKWFLKIRVKHGRRRSFDLATALRRSCRVWFRGMGMGIPGVNAVCMLLAYQRIKALHQTSWDRDDHVIVTHAPFPQWRIVFAAVIAIGSILLYTHTKYG